MDWSFRSVKPRFSHRAETWKQKPIELENILTILNLRGGNMGTGEPSFSSSQPLNFFFSVTVGQNLRPVIFLCFFCTFVISILILSCQSNISLLFIIYLEFWAWFSIINTSKEPNGRFGPFSHFRPLLQKCPQQNATKSYSFLAKKVGGANNLGFLRRDCHNFLQMVRKEIIEVRDGQSIINHFKRKGKMKIQCPSIQCK